MLPTKLAKFAASSLISLSPLDLVTLAKDRTLFLRSISQTQKSLLRAFRVGLPEIGPYALLGREGRVEVSLRLRIDDEWLPYTTLIPLLELLTVSGAQRVLEIGTQYGKTTWHLAANLPPGGQLTTVDLPPSATASEGGRETRPAAKVGAFYRDTPEADRITQVLADSRTLEPSTWPEGFDYIFIDGNHAYDFALSDSRTAAALLRPGGVIVWHDYYTLDPRIGVRTLLHRLRRMGLPVFHLAQSTCAVYHAGAGGAAELSAALER